MDWMWLFTRAVFVVGLTQCFCSSQQAAVYKSLSIDLQRNTALPVTILLLTLQAGGLVGTGVALLYFLQEKLVGA